MPGTERNEKSANSREIARNLISFRAVMPTEPAPYQIHSEARGPHWIAWISRGGDSKPERGIVLIGETQEEAEARARQWAEQSSY
jgi:hypothetical protein